MTHATHKTKDGLFSADVWLMGGISIVISMAFWLFVDRGASLVTISQVAFTLAFVCNHPHFLSSYVMLYGDYRKRLLTRPRYAWAGIVAPALLAAALVYSLAAGDRGVLAQVITFMYLLVGWHYVKQIFGCVIVTSVQRGIFLTQLERRVLLVNLFLTWFMSWLGSHVRPAKFDFYGISHESLELPPVLLDIVYAGVAISLGLVIATQVARYVRTGQKPSLPGVVAFTSLYVWYVPVMIHPAFAYMIPFFHSLQYLAFVGRLKNNQVRDEIKTLEGEAWRREWVTKAGGFVLAACGLGALAFQIVPAWLDQRHLVHGEGLGWAPMMAAFILFINIHHYFIDNVIWRSDNETVKAHLFTKAAPATQPATQPASEHASKRQPNAAA